MFHYSIAPSKEIGIYRVSHQYRNTFNFNFLTLYQCYCKSKTSSEKLRSKTSRGLLDFDFFLKIRLFSKVGRKRNKTGNFLAPCPHPLTNENELQYLHQFCHLLNFLALCPHPLANEMSNNTCQSNFSVSSQFLSQKHVLISHFFSLEFKAMLQGYKVFTGEVREWGHGARKFPILFRFLPTLKNYLIFRKKSKSRWPLESLDLSFSEEVLLLQQH